MYIKKRLLQFSWLQIPKWGKYNKWPKYIQHFWYNIPGNIPIYQITSKLPNGHSPNWL
jgi:hypothetical protein